MADVSKYFVALQKTEIQNKGSCKRYQVAKDPRLGGLISDIIPLTLKSKISAYKCSLQSFIVHDVVAELQ